MHSALMSRVVDIALSSLINFISLTHDLVQADGVLVAHHKEPGSSEVRRPNERKGARHHTCTYVPVCLSVCRLATASGSRGLDNQSHLRSTFPGMLDRPQGS